MYLFLELKKTLFQFKRSFLQNYVLLSLPFLISEAHIPRNDLKIGSFGDFLREILAKMHCL